MTDYCKANVCVRVRLDADEKAFVIDEGTLRVGNGDDYWATARLVASDPGSMVAVWLTDNLLIEDWPEGPLDPGKAREWVGRSSVNRVLVRAECDIFFEVAQYYRDVVRWPGVIWGIDEGAE